MRSGSVLTYITNMAKERLGVHLIADIAQVSRGTVDRALHGRLGINEATRQRVLEIARQIGYRPNLAARALSVHKASAKIGVCIPREIHFFYDQLWSGIQEEEERASRSGIEFINRPIQNLGEGDVEVFQELMSSGVDGIILTAGNPKQGYTRRLRRYGRFRESPFQRCLRGALSERVCGGRVAGEDCPARFESSCRRGHVDGGRPSEEGGGVRGDFPKALSGWGNRSRY